MLNQMKNPNKNIKSYVNSVPKSFDEFPLLYKGKDRENIKNTFLEFEVNLLEKYIGILFSSLKQTRLKDQYTEEELKKAFILVTSRNFGLFLKNEKKSYNTLIPFVDIFNYIPDTNTRWSSYLRNKDDNFTLKSIKSIKKGEQIFLNYGNKDNIKMLLVYGFTLENNIHNKQSSQHLNINHNDIKYTFSISHKNTKNFVNSISFFKLVKFFQSYKSNRSSHNSKNGDNEENKDDDNNFINEQRKNDLPIFLTILKHLQSFSKKKLINNLKNNLNATPNTINIYRALLAEESLIQKNIKFVEVFIEILEKGKKAYKKYIESNNIVVTQNKEYFTSLFIFES